MSEENKEPSIEKIEVAAKESRKRQESILEEGKKFTDYEKSMVLVLYEATRLAQPTPRVARLAVRLLTEIADAQIAAGLPDGIEEEKQAEAPGGLPVLNGGAGLPPQ
jgi:hypothetical protein